MTKTKLTGLFFGSFNPIHIGHMIIGQYMIENSAMNELWFIVSPQNPLKKKSTLLDDHHRLMMVKEAIADYPQFRASDIEFKMPQPSYTINTLTALKESYPDRNFALIIGMDNLQYFNKWRNYDQILENYQIIVYPRPGYFESEFVNHKNVTVLNAPLMEISSSLIRNSIKEGKDISFMLPKAVWKYIDEMRFYK